jgi:hypothetical protein
MDHSKKHYYEVTGTSPYGWKVYHYDSSGNKEVIVAKSNRSYDSPDRAHDAACEWLEDNNLDAEMV